MNKKSHDEAAIEFHFQVGRVIREWAKLEQSLFYFLSRFLKVDQFRARIISAAIINERARFDLISNLGETYLHESMLPEFRKLMKKANDLRLHRNLYAHASIGFGKRAGQYVVMRDTFPSDFDGTLTFEFRPINTNDIKTLADGISSHAHKMVRFVSQATVHTSARTHREQQSDPNQNTEIRPEISNPEEPLSPHDPSQE